MSSYNPLRHSYQNEAAMFTVHATLMNLFQSVVLTLDPALRGSEDQYCTCPLGSSHFLILSGDDLVNYLNEKSIHIVKNLPESFRIWTGMLLAPVVRITLLGSTLLLSEERIPKLAGIKIDTLPSIEIRPARRFVTCLLKGDISRVPCAYRPHHILYSLVLTVWAIQPTLRLLEHARMAEMDIMVYPQEKTTHRQSNLYMNAIVHCITILRIGPDSRKENEGVVNEELVFNHLSADSSIFPWVLGNYSQASSIALAERYADLILTEYKKRIKRLLDTDSLGDGGLL
ncbi:hypothetical protein GYMLUDRAFT_63421 [Collybiopsis luxurians FD-317 M1]|uniref:Uncharacterized protein n=1 Tax=Collybiopsis luxurians FD-317 M1 TaxID=944289 RepID=A0A0D0BWD2_9AGAR|nr:hypothetical protein GYMLUDRAFT_63421 [Collybiopsis luxurians FD-317 M1]